MKLSYFHNLTNLEFEPQLENFHIQCNVFLIFAVISKVKRSGKKHANNTQSMCSCYFRRKFDTFYL